MNYDVTIDVSVTATVTLTVQAENAQQARTLISEQLNQRVSEATDAVHEAFSEIIRKEPLDYTLDIEETKLREENDDDETGEENTGASRDDGS